MTTTAKQHNNFLEQIDGCAAAEHSSILQQLLKQPPSCTVIQKPRLNIKLDVEGLKEERHKLKRENLQLQKQLEQLRFQLATQASEIKRLKEFEVYF